MDVIWFYLFAVIPAVAGGVIWATGRKVVWGEWVGGSAIGFALAGIFHLLAQSGQTADWETLSGELMHGRHRAAWQEYYEEAIYRTEYYTTTEFYTDSNGKSRTRTVQKSRRVFSHWEPRRRWHKDEFEVSSNIHTTHGIDRALYYKIADSWGGVEPVAGRRRTGEHNSRMIGGDPSDYVTRSKGYVWPVTSHRRFENKIKATPTTFSFAKVPDGIAVFPYPDNNNPFESNRLLGTAAKSVNRFAFDQMNARLGPKKKVNVILIGFGDRDSMAAHWQEASWVGGKKNDVVICYGGPADKPTWARAFGWTEKKTCLRNLETIVLDNGVSTEVLPRIADAIIEGYVLKDWSKFDYIRVPAPPWAIWTYLCVAITAQGLFWWWAHHNEFEKGRFTARP